MTTTSGKVIRVDTEVYRLLQATQNAMRRAGSFASMNDALRSKLGLKDKTGKVER